ncbi:DNA-binding response regulator, NarL/FixJ family, contains REC and HTH domains [Kaistia soli DSM 19436]|uniref:DNA-binding response regulator, NarL/FixJ family, contains REC and HTH domains n=1 Tax=Kaistia soli DSM 19436 TaxID=1122133 RepID=A0A1M4Y1B0_9HYPH|nr:response regulator transcription factor [Kaistia soli]SHE99495.1 DNA-binding response regulator, NarL/FixJ family, contains REC and HTH domains [Kaistia soli DSM 19436]
MNTSFDLNRPMSAVSGSKTTQMENRHTLVLVDLNVLSRDCIGRALSSFGGLELVGSFGTVSEWLGAQATKANLAVIVQRGERPSASELQRDIERLRGATIEAPIILISDDEDPNTILRSLDFGVSGYIPSSVGLDVAFEAMRLVVAGGVFVPANSLLAYRQSVQKENIPPAPQKSPFTARQDAVVQLLRLGKSNKAIAAELNMRESTVKVHIRNVMKIMRAKNRTEIAVRTKYLDRADGDDK